jgi:hypothetical protein
MMELEKPEKYVPNCCSCVPVNGGFIAGNAGKEVAVNMALMFIALPNNASHRIG